MRKVSQRKKRKEYVARDSAVDVGFKFESIHPEQDEAWDAIDQHDVAFLTGPAGTAKAQPLSCRVMTPEGYKPMGDIRVGDVVCTPDGGRAVVGGVFPQGEKQVYRVTFSDGTSTRCCADHLWKVDLSGGPQGVVVDTRFLIEHHRTAPGYHAPNGKRVIAIPISRPVSHDAKPHFIDPYVMGVLLGDGCFRGFTVKIATADRFVVDEVSRRLHPDYKLSQVGDIEYSIVMRDRIGNEPNLYIDALKKAALWGKLSLEKHIPEEYLFSSQEDRLALLQGLMDADGCASKCSTTFSSSSPDLANGVMSLVQSLGGTATVENVQTSHAPAIRLHIKLPNEVVPFKLPRKAERVHERTKYFPKRFVDSIVPDGIEECQCIYVDDGKHLYITDHYIVTHNTFCAVAYAIEAVLSDEAEWIIITRPSVEAGERLGYLPGSGNQKIGPYLQPIYDTIDKLLTPGTKAHTKVKASVQVRPLAYMRGATFDNSIAILDEAQNVTIEQMRLWLSRIGKNTKMIACGDQAQTDLREMSCLVKVAQKLHGLPGVKHFIFSDRAIVRHDLIAPMMDRLAGI